MVLSAPLFGEVDLLEGLEVVRVNGEQPDVLVHALVHGAVELGERREVFADLVLLVGVFEQARGDDKADVLAVDQDLGEALVDAADAVGDVLEAAAVENGFLHTSRDEAEFQVFGDFADLAQGWPDRAPVRDRGAIAGIRGTRRPPAASPGSGNFSPNAAIISLLESLLFSSLIGGREGEIDTRLSRKRSSG